MASLNWSASLALAPESPVHLPGDKLLLPQAALEQLLAASAPPPPAPTSFDPYSFTQRLEPTQSQTLPHPLTFRVVNPANERVVYAGIREFSADDGQVVLSPHLRDALGLNDAPSDAMLTVVAKPLPKGTFVKLRPLEAGYAPEDWRALLEHHLRNNYTTLTNGDVLVVPSDGEEFRFLVDGFKPEGEGICIVDTDLEVDIEALNEEQARETVRRVVDRTRKQQVGSDGANVKLELLKARPGSVKEGEYADFEVPSWIRSQGVDISIIIEDEADDAEVALFVTPFGPRQRTRPRIREHVYSSVDSRKSRKVVVPPDGIDMADAEALWISVYAFPFEQSRTNSRSITFTIRVDPHDPASSSVQQDETSEPPDSTCCDNCLQWIPSRTLPLHMNFCLRNNTACPICRRVFQKRSPAFAAHWHCPYDDASGDSATSKSKHDAFFHIPATCTACSHEFPSISDLARHRTTRCPSKLILCRFCRLQVPQGAPSPGTEAEVWISGLTPHELADGARTTECAICGRFVRLRDLATHEIGHESEKRVRHVPLVCRNVLCGRTLEGVGRGGNTRLRSDGAGNDVGLCGVCFGPLYVAAYDPEGKGLRRRVERRYLSQLMTGCGRSWCVNEFCKTGKGNKVGSEVKGVSTKDALPVVRPLLEGLFEKDGQGGWKSPLHFCTEEENQRRRMLAERMAMEGVYRLEWCVAALEAEEGDIDSGRRWLENWAPKRTG